MIRRWPRSGQAGILGALALLLLVAGCEMAPTKTEKTDPGFVLRALNLRQKDPQGQPLWDLSSPESRYDLNRNLAQSLRPRGVIYADGQPRYTVSAESAVVLNDGEVIQLDGQILLQRLGEAPLVLRASRARWFPQRSLIELDRHPQVLDGRHQLQAGRARFRMDREDLELLNRPRLAGWSQPFVPSQGPGRTAPEWELRLPQLQWQLSSGQLQGRGPVEGWRRPPDRAATAPLQTLQASALGGNSRRQELELQGPVLAVDPLNGSRFQASRLVFQAEGQQLEAWDCRYGGPQGRSQARRCGWSGLQQRSWAEGGRSQLPVPARR